MMKIARHKKTRKKSNCEKKNTKQTTTLFTKRGKPWHGQKQELARLEQLENKHLVRGLEARRIIQQQVVGVVVLILSIDDNA